MRRPGVLLLALLLILAVTSWFSHQAGRREETARRAQRHVPDYFMNRFTTTVMNERGEARYRLSAERLRHFADGDTAELLRPRLAIFRAGERPWFAAAENGQVGPGGNVVYLSGGVELYRPESAEEGAVRLETDHMTVRPKEEYAETDAAVTMTGPRSRLEGTGMRAYLDDERLILLSDVYETHEPARP